MKKVAFLALILLTYYLAATYRSLPLLILCMAELFLSVILFFLPRFLRRKLNVSFLSREAFAEEGETVSCSVTVSCRGRLPVSRFSLRLRARYLPGARVLRKKLYGGCERGENRFDFQLQANHCGMLAVRMTRVSVYDYLALFASGKSLKEEMQVAVFPQKEALQIRLAPYGTGDGNLPAQQTVNAAGEANEEIRQIREYRVGDSARYIHWNQSARTDALWIKEYEKDVNYRVKVFADTSGFYGASAAALGAFYKLLSALVLGLLRVGAVVTVLWYDCGRECMASAEVTEEEQCRDMLLMLYRTKFLRVKNSVIKAAIDRAAAGEKNFLKLTLDLMLFAENRPVTQFLRKEIEREIQERILFI